MCSKASSNALASASCNIFALSGSRTEDIIIEVNSSNFVHLMNTVRNLFVIIINEHGTRFFLKIHCSFFIFY